MSYENIGKLVDRWMADTNFRVAVRKDPEGAVRGTGIRLSDEELAALRNVDWSMSDEKLITRISTAFG